MRISNIISFTVAVFCAFALQGQTIVKDNEHLQAYNALHAEAVYIHHNASLFLAGEQMYYAVYCVDKATNQRSILSKMAYVELVGADGVSVFKHKIRLDSGIGQGDFFIPTTVPTGNYKLLGYTQWMKNSDTDNFFKSDINIVNPFQKNRDLILGEAMSSMVDSMNIIETQNRNTGPEPQLGGLKILTNGTTYGKRDKVQLILQNSSKDKGFGTYSISVRKIGEVSAPEMIRADKFLRESKAISSEQTLNDSIYLPELRGDILFGRVVSKTTDSLVSNVQVALSIPGMDYIIKIARTNGEGVFYFNLDKGTDQNNAYLQILGEQAKTNKIIIGENQFVTLRGLKFNTLEFTPQMARLLVDRSVHNQIENAYLDVKRDSLLPIYNNKQFYHKYEYEYVLDDYTRFPTIKEVMLEVVENVWTAKNREGKRELHIRGYDNIPGIKVEPMILVDGLLLQDHEGIMDIDARKIKKIGLKRNKFRMGPATYIGILAFETFDGTFHATYQNEHIFTHELFSPLRHKMYYKQNYEQDSSKELDPLPDFRYQLLWTPAYDLNEGSIPINFYTSDVSGDFEISVEGITNEGNPVSLRANFTVE